jgi:hypothetical protein
MNETCEEIMYCVDEGVAAGQVSRWCPCAYPTPGRLSYTGRFQPLGASQRTEDRVSTNRVQPEMTNGLSEPTLQSRNNLRPVMVGLIQPVQKLASLERNNLTIVSGEDPNWDTLHLGDQEYGRHTVEGPCAQLTYASHVQYWTGEKPGLRGRSLPTGVDWLHVYYP